MPFSSQVTFTSPPGPSSLNHSSWAENGSLSEYKDIPLDDIASRKKSFVVNNEKTKNKADNEKGLGWFVTGLFVVGVQAGGGLVALPTAIVRVGFWTGLLLSLLMFCVFTYTSHILGRCWVILQQRWPDEYTGSHCRKPYPEIGYRALGPKMKSIVSFTINITMFGIAVVFLVLSSKNIHDFLKVFFNINLSFCIIAVVLALLILPIVLLKSPKDFWVAVVLAMFTTSTAVFLILLGAGMDYEYCTTENNFPPTSFSNFFLTLGTFIFVYGGHASFPTIQHDMHRPYEFTKSSFLAFITVALMYTPVSLMGYFAYGDSLRDSIINSLQTVWIQQTVNILITLHCLLTLCIIFSPLNQEAEEFFNIPQHFCIKRVLVRGGIMASALFFAETLPNFGALMDLIGGSTIALTSLVFPSLFYLYLKAGENMVAANTKSSRQRSQEERPTLKTVLQTNEKQTLLICSIVLVLGLVGGLAATFSAIRQISYTHFVPPCYVSYFTDNSTMTTDHLKTINCCGFGQNISRLEPSDQFCTSPDLNFYLS